MEESIEVRNAQTMAIAGLIVAARKVNESLGSFSGWLIAGVGGAFTLLLGSYETVSRFVCVSNIKAALLLLVIGLIVSIFARLLSAIVSSALGSHDASTALFKQHVQAGEKFDVARFISEFERGLFPYQRWVAQRTMKKALSGDIVASARLIAKLSQAQALLVLSEALLAITAAAALVSGLKTM
ncbi:hypothetical protein [Noviherbaspirillum massiliense]|uniref:hypothetical protein n=1 Tax=Noviherbaspirillum massiliense TaxID=1465823 RepID=UPI0011DC73C0|nr:hypothetical protein [Noviherbaspirillum massiliense]